VSATARAGDLIDLALAEDVGTGDVTTEATVPADARGVADVVVREAGVVCGLEAAFEVFRRLDPDAEMTVHAGDGTAIDRVPARVATVHGSYRALLTGERTALNLLQRLSGIATATREYVDAVHGTGASILDTRKTAPGLRALDKHAVACGGGRNHRAGLDDAVLIKDNHVAVAGGVVPAVRAMRAHRPDLPVEVEVDTLDQLDEALAERAEMILLDNMTTAQLREAVRRTGGRARLEASGGITLATARAVAETGVDALSVGALTHSVRALDVALEVTPSQP
jgi:nicotinate-nucleotide pyrophosphorylase (carboxylating)